MSNIAYIRVSTEEQNEARQIAALRPFNIDKWFIEKIIGKNTDRPKFKEMMNYIREADTIYIKDFSHLSRSSSGLLNIVDELEHKNIRLISLKENLDTSTPTGKLMLIIIAAINELEHQKEGIKIAKENGVYKGRKRIEKPLNWHEVYKQYQTKEITANEAMKKLNLKHTIFYRFVKEEKNNYVPTS